MPTSNLWRISPRTCERITVTMMTKAAERMLVCRRVKRSRLLDKKEFAIKINKDGKQS